MDNIIIRKILKLIKISFNLFFLRRGGGVRQFIIFISNNEFEAKKWHEHHLCSKGRGFSLFVYIYIILKCIQNSKTKR